MVVVVLLALSSGSVSVDELLKRLLSRSWDVADAAVIEALDSGTEGELALGAALGRATSFRRVVLAAALGDLRAPGPADDALRQAAVSTGPGTRDLRCAALVALAKRLGRDATPEYVLALRSSDSGVREYAIACLSSFGDDRAWPDVIDWFSKYRPSRTLPPPSRGALTYLLRHCAAQDESRRRELAVLIRRKWPLLERERSATQVISAWPEVAPDGAQSPWLSPPTTPERTADMIDGMFSHNAVLR